MKNVAIFASGSGTNAENIARYFSKSETVKVAVVLSNNKNVGVHARVNKLGIPSFVFSRDEFVEGTPILAKLAEYQIDLIVLAGFMNKISDTLLNAYPGKIINIHPALLPKHGGKGMYGMHMRLSWLPERRNRALQSIILMRITTKAISFSRLHVKCCLPILPKRSQRKCMRWNMRIIRM